MTTSTTSTTMMTSTTMTNPQKTTKPHGKSAREAKVRQQTKTVNKLKGYLILGSLIATWLSGGMLAQQDRIVELAETQMVAERESRMPQAVATSRSSK